MAALHLQTIVSFCKRDHSKLFERFSKNLLQFISAILLIAVLAAPLYAQNSSQLHSQKTYTLIFQGVSLQRALQRLVNVTQIDLVYDPKIMPDRTVFSTVKDERPKDILRDLLK